MSKKVKILSVVGTRPNFVKIAAIDKAFLEHSGKIEHVICHTGQHFSPSMSEEFYNELGITPPSYFLEVSSGSHAQVTAEIMVSFERIVQLVDPDYILVVGDVNSTMAAAVVASKLHVPLIHVEAGLRSFDKEMPEEVNRIITDQVTDLFFITEQSAMNNLLQEGVDSNKVHFVGNVMIDTLLNNIKKIDAAKFHESIVDNQEFILVTFHRPSNVDKEDNLRELVSLINELSKLKKVIFPIHPRTKSSLQKGGFQFDENVIQLGPVTYFNFLSLVKNASLVVTDSGGIQEETTFFSIPCITLRNSTERPVTEEIGTNYMAGANPSKALVLAKDILQNGVKPHKIPHLWDGNAANRIAQIILQEK